MFFYRMLVSKLLASPQIVFGETSPGDNNSPAPISVMFNKVGPLDYISTLVYV